MIILDEIFLLERFFSCSQSLTSLVVSLDHVRICSALFYALVDVATLGCIEDEIIQYGF